MTITKLDVAECEIVAAVNLLFGGGDPIPVYVLASAAREITTALCEKRGLRLHVKRNDRGTISFAALWDHINVLHSRFRSFDFQRTIHGLQFQE